MKTLLDLKELRVRTLITASIGSAVISLSSLYVALRMGALPWPTVFVAILSMGILKWLKNTNINEINVAHTGMSAGALVAGGIAFTIPGIWIINKSQNINFLFVFLSALLGTVIGLIGIIAIRAYFIEKSNLPYPIGVATANTLIAGDEGGKKAKIVFSSLLFSSIVTFLRDGFSFIPQVIFVKGLTLLGIGFFISPMALGIGYIIGITYMGVWFIGSVIGNLIFPLFLTNWLSTLEKVTNFKVNLGIGLIIGGGVAIVLKDIFPKTKEIFLKSVENLKIAKIFIIVALGVVLVLEIAFLNINFITATLIAILTLITIVMAAYIDGATGIVPMEIFGIIVLLVVKFITPYVSKDYLTLFAIAAVVSVATGITGDNLQDFKTGNILKTNPNAQLISELTGGIVGSIFGTLGLFILYKAYGSFGPSSFLVAPQAFAVSQMIQGLKDPRAFLCGFILGVFLYFFHVPSMILGIGIYLPFTISSTAFIGSLIKALVIKVKKEQNSNGELVASGLLGGEGFAGTIVAIIRFIWRL